MHQIEKGEDEKFTFNMTKNIKKKRNLSRRKAGKEEIQNREE